MKEEYLPGPRGGTKGINYIDITATKNGQINNKDKHCRYIKAVNLQQEKQMLLNQ